MPGKIVSPSPEELLMLIGPEATNLLNLLKQIKRIDPEVTVLLTKALPLPEAHALEARALSGVLMPFGGLMLRIGTVESSAGLCWMEVEPYGSVDEEYFRAHWNAVFAEMKLLLDEVVGVIVFGPRLGGITFIVPA